MRTFAIMLMAVMMLAATAHAGAPTSAVGGYGMSWSVTYHQQGDGTWEYAYDLFAEGDNNWYDYFAMKFDFGNSGTVTDHILNMYDPGTGLEHREYWTVNGMLGNRGGDGYWGGIQTGVQASYGDLESNTWFTDPTTTQANEERWFIDPTYAAAEGMANPFHLPSDYAHWYWTDYYTGLGDAAFGLFAGMQGDQWTGTGSYYTPLDTHMAYDMTWFRGGHMYGGYYGPELMATFRIVSDLGPYGEVSCQYYGSGTSGISAIVGPGAYIRPGDFNGDGNYDAEDIDILADAIAAGSTDAQYDLNGDSVVDEQDLVYHIAVLVDRTDGGIGTYRGDFNLDGYVNGTDLAILKAGFGLTGLGYAAGNANADEFINGTDLAIFKATFGLSGTPGDGGNPPAVPEPATISLLTLGALAALRRRRK
jgi:hypothetical protein